MAADVFSFFRGAAAVMAWDLAHAPHTDLYVQACGDAHMMNFGVYAAPSRELVFDANDFDETLPGPWEFDLKRLTVSLVVAAQSAGFDAAQAESAVRNSVRSYRRNIVEYGSAPDLAVWYSRIRMDDVQRLAAGDDDLAQGVDRVLHKAAANTAERAYARMVDVVGDTVRFRSDPPTLVRIDDLPAELAGSVAANVGDFRHYVRSLPEHLRVLMGRYELVDAARKVVGVGSVGTQDYVVLLRGRRLGDPLILQIKQAVRSVHEDHLRASRYRSPGARIVAGQYLVQSATDPFLGWFNAQAGTSFYVRQFRDAKGGLDLARMTPKVLDAYGALCAWVLGRAHARSGDSLAIKGYLGGGRSFEDAMVNYSFAYAEQNLADYQRFCAADASEAR